MRLGRREACPTLQLLVAGTGGTTFELVDELAIGADAVPGVLAPERAVVVRSDRRILDGFDVQTLPAQLLAAVHGYLGESGSFHSYPFCLAASSSARLTATRARVTL